MFASAQNLALIVIVLTLAKNQYQQIAHERSAEYIRVGAIAIGLLLPLQPLERQRFKGSAGKSYTCIGAQGLAPHR